MEQSDFPDLSGDLSARELAEVMAAAKAAGMVAQITFVDDPNSPEGQAAAEYVNSHHWLPKNYRTLLRSEVEALGKTLLDPAAGILEKKKALMLLGHRGSIEAYRILKTYAKSAPAELRVWSKMAFDECKTFLATELSEETQLGFNIVLQKTGRNAPCPCGSGKKYKRCCGAVE
jgi:uncharacterized protein YchJ